MGGNKPKYQILVEWIKQQITDGVLTVGDKFYSENELGNMFGYSRQTVRQAISIAEDDGYLESRRGSGTYVVFQPQMTSAKTMTIGVVSTYVDDYIFPPIIRGIGKVLSKNGYSMQLHFTQNRVENERQALQNMLEKGVDGIVVEPTKSGLPNPNMELYKQIAERNIPVIYFNAYYPDTPFPHVMLDDKAAGKIATQRLIKAGHTKISGIFQSDDKQGHLRYAGYVEALIENGLQLNANRVLWFATEDIPGLFKNEERINERLKNASAAVCYNDVIAVALMEFLRAHSYKIPQDFSVVSIDNSALAEFCEPPLTSVNHPKEILGKKVAENLLKKIDMPGFDATVNFEAKLVERASVAKHEETDN